MAEQRMEADIAIIGGGGAGVAASMEAGAAGAKVALIEQFDALGGTAIISGGGCLIVGTPLQKSQGIRDTPELAFEDWVKWGQGSADEQWARFYIEHSLHDLYFWAERLGVKWIDMKFQEGNRVHRWHRPDNNGLGLMTALINALKASGAARILTGAAAKDILTQNGKVCSIRATSAKNKKTTEIHSKTV